jgi:hypothetical protein
MIAWLLCVSLLQGEVPPESSPKSEIWLRSECRNDLGRREITLFGNGTVRLREGLKDDERMTLGELGPEELEAFLARLRAEDLREVPPRTDNVLGGPWVETCRLDLSVPEMPRREFRYGRYDSLSLGLSRVLRIVEDIAAQVDPSEGETHLPPGYQAKPGDVLLRVDGEAYRVVRETADKQGLELIGLRQPLTIYIPKGQLAAEFVELLSRDSR